MLRKLEGLFITVGSLIWFLCLTPWGSFADPDAFYHAHISGLILDQGPLKAFPWLDLTTLGRSFADQHFLYHLLLIPGIAIARIVTSGPFAELWATQAAAPLLATGTVLMLWMILRHIDRARAWIWTITAMFVPAFSMRLLLGKASPLAISFFIATIGIFFLPLRGHRRIIFPFLVGCVFALSHGGWIIALLAGGAVMFGNVLFKKFGEDASWRTIVRESRWPEWIAMLIGITTGLLIHPNHTALLQFLWVQVVEAGVGTTAKVIQGGEWAPGLPSFITFQLAVPLIILLIAFFGIVMSVIREVTFDREQLASRMQMIVALAMPVALTLALTLKSRRFIEYLAPAAILWVAAIWRLVDEKQLIASVREAVAEWPRMLQRVAPAIAIVLALAVVIHQGATAAIHLRRVGSRPFDAWRHTMAAISNRAQPGDRVFHSDWDEFPNLFAADDRLRYVSGLDPVFLANGNPALSDAVYGVTLGISPTSTWDVITNKTGSRFVFITTKRHPKMDAALKNDPRFEVIARTDDTAAYIIRTE